MTTVLKICMACRVMEVVNKSSFSLRMKVSKSSKNISADFFILKNYSKMGNFQSVESFGIWMNQTLYFSALDS